MPLGFSMIGSGDLGSAIAGLTMICISGVILVGSIALLILGGKSNPEYGPLKTDREGWQKRLLPHKDRQLAVSTFGDLTSEQLQNIYNERIAFLNPILGNDFQKYLSTGE
jgi:hypothetical protein